MTFRTTSSAYPIAIMPSLGKVDSREFITIFHTNGDRISPVWSPWWPRPLVPPFLPPPATPTLVTPAEAWRRRRPALSRTRIRTTVPP